MDPERKPRAVADEALATTKSSEAGFIEIAQRNMNFWMSMMNTLKDAKTPHELMSTSMTIGHQGMAIFQQNLFDLWGLTETTFKKATHLPRETDPSLTD